MAEKVQINPRIRVLTKTQLEQAARDRECTVGEIVESAVQAFLQDGAGAGHEAGGVINQMLSVQGLQTILLQMQELCARLAGLEQSHRQVTDALSTLLAYAKEQGIAKEEPPPIATYEQMYESLANAVADEREEVSMPPPRPRGWVSRLFWREVG